MKPILLLMVAGLMVLGLAATTPRTSSHGVAAVPDPVAGNPAAKVRVIVYQDLECPSCAQWHGVLEKQVIPEFGSKVAFEFRDFPLTQHLWSFNAAVLARYFDTVKPAIGMAWRDFCFTHQTELTPDTLLDQAVRWSATYGIKRAQIEGVFSRSDLFALVEHDKKLGHADNVVHTPTVLLNGVEATTPEELTKRLTAAVGR